MYEREKLSTAEDQNGMLSRYGLNFIFLLLTLIYNGSLYFGSDRFVVVIVIVVVLFEALHWPKL